MQKLKFNPTYADFIIYDILKTDAKNETAFFKHSAGNTQLIITI